MSIPPAPKSREHAPSPSVNVLNTRRSFTLPARANRPPPAPPASASSGDGIETLFICNSSKIVSFTASGPVRRPSPSRSATAAASTSVQPAAWTTPTERTLAVGVLRIYRVTASNVSFLNSGNLLHTIFPRSQCWCVDGQSIFVLRIRQDSFYRIELPFESEQDKEKTTQFKTVLAQVLQYERTQCPFARGFEVDVPDRPKTPPRRTLRRKPSQQAKKWMFDKTWVPETGSRPSTPNVAGSDCGTASSYDDDDRSSIHTDTSEVVTERMPTVADVGPSKSILRRPSVAERASVFQGFRSRSRSVTAPVKSERSGSIASLGGIPESPAPPKASEAEKPILERQVSEAASLVSSAGSFYSADDASDRNPSTPFWDAEADLLNPWMANSTKPQDELRGRSTHRRQVSEITVRAQSAFGNIPSAPATPTTDFHTSAISTNEVHPSSAPSTPPLVSDSDDDSIELPALDAPTPPNAIRMKRLTGASQRRAFSPMPQAQNLFRPPQRNLGRNFTSALVRKTCELVLGPPSHLVSIMLRIAASISNGFGFSTYRVRPAEKIPCSWESDDDADWQEEDDFGIPLGTVGNPAIRRQTFSAGELD
ncbi:hypothetical protein J1614_011499 [Plenodomus biglobosus]|nr:hypothetical protein J1614_011499 [Plenodomus biglobosus]